MTHEHMLGERCKMHLMNVIDYEVKIDESVTATLVRDVALLAITLLWRRVKWP